MTTKETIGQNIKTARARLGLSQRALAKNTDGVTQADISRFEAGVTMPSADKLSALAKTLRVPVQDLYSGVSSNDKTRETFEAFCESGLAAGISEQEREELRKAVWVWGPPNIEAWYHALLQLRAIRKSNQET